MDEKIQVYRLKNGMRIVHLGNKYPVAYCGVFIDAGSRDESINNWGVAHFTEHMMFKGTTNRRSHHIINRIEGIGGELNAYTTKEDTCIHATFLPQYYERIMELFSDVLLRSVFPEKEVKKEREIILDEINSYKDSPSELIFDDFEEILFKGESLGRNILGNEQSVRGIDRETIVAFRSAIYSPERVVLSSVGDIPFDKLCRWAERYFGDWQMETKYERPLIKHINYQCRRQEYSRNTYQTHCVIGNLAYNMKDDKRFILGVLTNMLGGPAMNSKLNLSLREKYGYAYNTEASYTPYSDTGIFSIYFGTDESNYVKCLNIIKKELKVLCAKKINSTALQKIKNQLIGQMTISAAGGEAQMFSIGKSLLVYNKVTPMEAIFRKINRISAEKLQEVANEILTPDKLTVLVYR